MSQGVDQGIHWGDEDVTQLVTRVYDSEPGVLERGQTAAGQETGFGFLTSCSSIERKKVDGILLPASVTYITTSCCLEASGAPETSGKQRKREP